MPVDSSEIVEQPDNRAPLTLEEEASVVPAVEVEDDFIYRTVREDEGPDNILKAVMEGLAEEQSALRILRQEKQREGKDSSHISMKRGTLLKYMSETILQRQSIVGPTEELNVRGNKFREVFKMFLTVISDTFDHVRIPSEYKDLFFQRLSQNLEGWEAKAETAIKAIEGPK